MLLRTRQKLRDARGQALGKDEELAPKLMLPDEEAEDLDQMGKERDFLNGQAPYWQED